MSKNTHKPVVPEGRDGDKNSNTKTNTKSIPITLDILTRYLYAVPEAQRTGDFYGIIHKKPILRLTFAIYYITLKKSVKSTLYFKP